MKYEVIYTIQKEVRVIIKVKDETLNADFKRLGEIKSDADFQSEDDPRWAIEEMAYNEFSSGGTEETVYRSDEESIVNRSIKILPK